MGGEDCKCMLYRYLYSYWLIVEQPFGGNLQLCTVLCRIVSPEIISDYVPVPVTCGALEQTFQINGYKIYRLLTNNLLGAYL